ncbi:MAG: hypothetical protein LKE33_05765 [Acidaminococcus sp.]|nr:hypothetical protein [Acidaminococcus sp.]MCI2100254.1 hypothetical protein [Acidaminococcus sp.]MCI2114574.1 hypothetical protein [Acidaminococcus sp.]MCI2116551.1 hypothetical protein [Acidaminococcus sp.]
MKVKRIISAFSAAAMLLVNSIALAAADQNKTDVVNALVKLRMAPEVQMSGEGRFHSNLFSSHIDFKSEQINKPDFACAITTTVTGTDNQGKAIKSQKIQDYIAKPVSQFYHYRQVNGQPWTKDKMGMLKNDSEAKVRKDFEKQVIEVMPVAEDEHQKTLAAVIAAMGFVKSEQQEDTDKPRQVSETTYIITIDKKTGLPQKMLWDSSPLMQTAMKQKLLGNINYGESIEKQAFEMETFVHSISLLCTINFTYDRDTVITVPEAAKEAETTEKSPTFINPFTMQGSIMQSL